MVVSGSGRRFSLILLVVCACTLNLLAATNRKKKPSPAKQEQTAPPPAQAIEETSPAELTLEQKPAVPPRVTYQNNQLTIVAENSTLGDVLRAVKTQTGASIDLPANTNARVVANLGPGPSRDVLAHLLNGTLFNYVLLGTMNDPAGVGKIILIPKPMGNEPQTAANVPANMQQTYPAVNPQGPGSDESEQTDTEAPPPTEEENSANTTEQPEQPEQPAAAPNNGQPQNLRTPDQLLQELQRQQLLQQQMQQQQSSPQQPNQQQPEPNQEQQ